MTDEKKLIEFLKTQGYKRITQVEGLGLCGIQTFMFTTGLVVGLNRIGYKYRYCYPHYYTSVAIAQLHNWSKSKTPITEDPQDQFWIKKKGGKFDLTNPLYLVP